jgi:hypothetical protein
MSEQQTIQSVIQGLGDDLRAYLEAQYHVRDESVLHERKLLLQDGATIAQEPKVRPRKEMHCCRELRRLCWKRSRSFQAGIRN